MSQKLLKQLVAQSVQEPLPLTTCCICERAITNQQRKASKLTWWIDTNGRVNAAGVVHDQCCPVTSVVDDDGVIWFKYYVHATDVTPQKVWELVKAYANYSWHGSSMHDFKHNAFLLARWFGVETYK